MEKFQLQLFLQIIGIGSASGLLFHNDLLYLISDNSTYLYEYNMDLNTLNKIALVDNPQENILKKDKPDFEFLSKFNDELYIFGSGSQNNRMQNIVYNLKDFSKTEHDLTSTYFYFINKLKINKDQLNIEGIIHKDDYICFFQRGNGINNKNAIIKTHNFKETKPELITIELPKINDIEASFTDAILVDETIYFLASVENTISTYEDGEILGTFLGKMKLTDFFIEETILISNNHKFEGITLFKKTEKQLEFLLCEDNDTDLLESTIYKLTINK